MKLTHLPYGIHTYENILSGIQEGLYEFQEVSTLGGRCIPLIGISPNNYSTILSLASSLSLRLILYGSRVAGPRTIQRALHPVLAQGITLQCTGRHASVGLPGFEGVKIPKDAIKELGFANPLTSDISIVALPKYNSHEADLTHRAKNLEYSLNNELNLPFPIRVYLEVFGWTFRNPRDFLVFARECYIKRELPVDHKFSDAEIEAAFSLLFHEIPVE